MRNFIEWLKKLMTPEGTLGECRCGHVTYYRARPGQPVTCKKCKQFIRLPAEPEPKIETVEDFAAKLHKDLSTDCSDEIIIHVQAGKCEYCGAHDYYILREGTSCCRPVETTSSFRSIISIMWGGK